MISIRSAKFLVVLVTHIISYNLAQAAVQINEETIEKLNALVTSKIPWNGNTPAYSILIDQGGKIVYERNIGFADIGNQVAASRDTVYKIGSITKSYTALAILQLVEKGQINLDAKVSYYLADFEGPAAEVTIAELLTHTSGIPNYTDLPEGEELMAWVVTTRENIVNLFDDKPLEFEPGTHFNYSNSGYYLLGLVIESVTGQDYFDYVKAHVFTPLGLRATYTGAYEEVVPHQARGYLVTPEGFINGAPTPQLTPFSAGTLEASAADLIKYRRAVFRSKVTSNKLRELITRTGTFPGGTQQRYALGALVVSDFYGHRKWGHSGGITGFSSYHDYFPDDDITVVVLVNANGAPISPANLASKMERVIFSIPQPDQTKVEVSEKLLESYAGKYRMGHFRMMGEYVCIVLEQGVLQLQVNDDIENPVLMALLPRSNQEFVLAEDDELRIRFNTESAKVTGLEFVTNNGVSPAYKLAAEEIPKSGSSLNDFITSRMHDAHIPGFAGAIVVDGQVVWTEGFGLADISSERAVTADTVFVMASVSKTMTATALMLAVESGALSLDDDLNRYLPFHLDNPKVEGEVITPRHLATHMSGILDNDPVYGSPVSYYMGGDNPIELGEFLREYLVPEGRFYDHEQNFGNYRPGDRWNYSNIGAGLAGYLLERSTGIPLDRYCEINIFEPLAMSSTSWHISNSDISRHAIPYNYENGQYVAYPHYGLATWPDGGLRTTARDLGRFLAMIMQDGQFGGRTVLKSETVVEMLKTQPGSAKGKLKHQDPSEQEPSQSIFWYGLADQNGVQKYIGHTGSDPGTKTFMAFDPVEKIGVLGFANVSRNESVHRSMLDLMQRLFKEGTRIKHSR